MMHLEKIALGKIKGGGRSHKATDTRPSPGDTWPTGLAQVSIPRLNTRLSPYSVSIATHTRRYPSVLHTASPSQLSAAGLAMECADTFNSYLRFKKLYVPSNPFAIYWLLHRLDVSYLWRFSLGSSTRQPKPYGSYVSWFSKNLVAL